MGTPFAVTYACIYLAELEYELTTQLSILSRTNPKIKPPLYLVRFIDDIFGIFSDTYNANIFLEQYRLLRPNYIKLTSIISTTRRDVLDITIYKDAQFSTTGLLQTTLYQKPHNRFLFIPPSSFHENFNWIQDYANRIRIICSEDAEYNKHIHNLRSQLLRRGHSPAQIQQHLTTPNRSDLLLRATHNRNNQKRTKQQQQNNTPIVFKITRTPRTNGIKHELKNILTLTKHALIDPDTTKIFDKRQTPLLCVKRPKNISNMLVRARINTKK